MDHYRALREPRCLSQQGVFMRIASGGDDLRLSTTGTVMRRRKGKAGRSRFPIAVRSSCRYYCARSRTGLFLSPAISSNSTKVEEALNRHFLQHDTLKLDSR